MLEYLWGASAQSIPIAGATSSREGVPIRLVQIGASGGAELAMPAAALRSSSIELKVSGLGSVGLPRLVSAIGGVFGAASGLGVAPHRQFVPLSDLTATRDQRGSRIVYLMR